MTVEDWQSIRYASPPCMAGDVAPNYFDPLAVDVDQARDVARWRRAERARLRAARGAMDAAEWQSVNEVLNGTLCRFLSQRFVNDQGNVLSGYWPIDGEPDLRPLMVALHESGVTVALPVMEVKAAPLAFRRWTPSSSMVRDGRNIPVPPPEAERLTPRIVLAPLIGWDGDGYRLGHGGGYFDRTLAALTPRPFTIGVGFHAARLATIYPQPHDVSLDVILTEKGVEFDRGAG